MNGIQNKYLDPLYSYRFYVLGILFLMNLALFWPGDLQPDSQGQYIQAITGQYSDHHPPMMSFVWHYLDKIYTGSGLMLAMQLGFFYGALGMLLRIVDACLPQKHRPLAAFVLLLLPLYPQILVYSGTIVKDNQFAFSFLFIMSILAYYTITGKRLSLWLLAALLPILIYGMSVKFQAQYCSVIIMAWMGALVTTSSLLKKAGAACLIGILAFGSMTAINDALVPEKKKNYSWQYVKLYDLAAISIGAQADLIPDTNKTAEYTFQDLKAQFVHYRVDPLVFGTHPPPPPQPVHARNGFVAANMGSPGLGPSFLVSPTPNF